jgi:hypothetical protein
MKMSKKKYIEWDDMLLQVEQPSGLTLRVYEDIPRLF